MQKYVIVYFLVRTSESEEFLASEWPLHITLLANFTINRPLVDLKILLRNYCQQTKPFNVSVQGEALFGAKHNVAVSLIQPNQNISSIHQNLADLASNLGATFDEAAYMGTGYRPHATIQAHSRLMNKQVVSLSEFTLVDMFPDHDMNRRRIIETYTFTSH